MRPRLSSRSSAARALARSGATAPAARIGRSAGPNLPNRVAQAHAQDRLGGIFQNVDDLAGVGLEVETLAIAEQVKFGVLAHEFRQALAEFAVEKTHDLADALQGESLAA